jgi:hypothetical protein
MAATVEFLAAVAYIERQVAANELAQVRLIAPALLSAAQGAPLCGRIPMQRAN